MAHNHNWQQLYLTPSDSKFLSVYEQAGLEKWVACKCGAIACLLPDGKARILPEKKKAGRIADAQRWNESVAVWCQNFAASE